MNLNTANLKVGIVASTDSTRRKLTGIHVTPKGTEACNGYIIAQVSLPSQYDSIDVPKICPTAKAENLKKFIAPISVMKIKPFKNRNQPILNNTIFIDVVASNKNNTAKFSATDLETTITPEFQKIDAEFPDLEKVMPSSTLINQKTFNINYLEKLLEIAKSVSGDYCTVTLSVYEGENAPLLMETSNRDTNQNFRGLIMPCQT